MRLACRSICLFTLVAASAAFAQPSERQFANRSCHLAFAYPATWEVVSDTTDGTATCSFALRPRDWQPRLLANDSVDFFTIQVRVFPRGVWRQAPESGFERRAHGWVVLGRMGESSPADSIAGSRWSGLRGIAAAGCYREGGGYVGLCDTPVAVLGTQTRSVVLVAGPRSENVFGRVIATLRLDR